MATLVLTTVGGLLGGPIGAALGGVLGQTVDRGLLFRPRGRQGPRLTELAVQTSSYGTQVPRLFGTTRVAGSVIWATDLIETRSTEGGGKGTPSMTSYSYSANFAVLLSGRRIRSVRRIWAEGKLLRGAAGDWKVRTSFRLHLGDETQAPDPLIAAAEGAASTPAHRGCAYAVFEGLPLAEFGNRIPSLTFEVEADAEPVALGAVVEALSDGALRAGEGALPLTGYAASGDSIRGAVEGLLSSTGAWVGADGVRTGTGTAPAVEDAGARAGETGGARRGVRAIAPADTVPTALTLAHYDPARDYQTGTQLATRGGPAGRSARMELPVVLEAGAARALATRALGALALVRERRSVAVDWSAAWLRPGDRVLVAGEAGQWRVTGWALEHMVLTLELQRIAQPSAVAGSPSTGRPVLAPDALHGATVLEAFELPVTGADRPRVAVAAAGTLPGWRSATLIASEDGGARWEEIGRSADPAVIGRLAIVPAPAPATLEDRRSVIEVVLAHDRMALAGADAGAMDLGANLAMVGDELLQFGEAVQVGAARWRLRRLWRGLGGTDAWIGTQQPGQRFVLLQEAALRWYEPRRPGEGAPLLLRAIGTGDPAEGAQVRVPVNGGSVRPLAPEHLAAVRQPDGTVQVRWVRRGRFGGWPDGTDVPLGEEREAYQVEMVAESGTILSLTTAEPHLMLLPDQLPSSGTIHVRQIGRLGLSPAAVVALPLSMENHHD